MPLDLSTLKSELYDAFADMISDDLPEESAIEAKSMMRDLADRIGEAIDKFIKSGDVKTNVTIPVTSVQGSLSTGYGEGSIS